ncbi:hypothetical protein Tco_1069730 [Tanacetum coccineum]|uniref:Uncharacterized protein n=1 Tax=Tanacetum coccineum TaxID=301880 RepID=A0ABQ5HLL2_9ASTR
MVMLAEKMRQKLILGSTSQADATNDEMGYKEERQVWLLSVDVVPLSRKNQLGPCTTKSCPISEETLEDTRAPVNSIGAANRLLTPSMKVQLLIYFMLKYAMETLLSEFSVVTTYYFQWTTGKVAIILACLGLTVLSVNVIVGSYISNMFEDRQILLVSEIVFRL